MKSILKNLSFIKWFIDIRKELSMIRYQLNMQTKVYQTILKHYKSTSNKGNKLMQFEHQTFSQNGEDGILQEIFYRQKIKMVILLK